MNDEGFTLIETIISVVILAIVVGAVTVALITVLTLSGATSKNISDSADSQAVSATLTTDVKGAAEITTAAAPTGSANDKCGPNTATQLLGLEWGQKPGTTNPQPSTFDTVVSYLAVKEHSAWSLVRAECTNGFSAHPAASHTISSDICEPSGSSPVPNGCAAAQLPPTITPTTKNTTAATKWTSAVGVLDVSFLITEPGSHYTYKLVAEPVSGSAPSGTTTVAPVTPACSYATPGSGKYAQTLCFVNFATYNYTKAAYPSCETMREGITGTPFTLSFCVSVQAGTESTSSHKGEAPPTTNSWRSVCSANSPAGSGSGVPPPPKPPKLPLCSDPPAADIVAVPFPTYTNPPSSEAFLGNNGFYTGVENDPALYEYLEGTAVTLYFTKIKVLDQNNNPATNWQLVTGDAESTDPGESLTWSTCPATPGGALEVSCTSNTPNTPHNLSLVPNNPTASPEDYYGNACANTKYTNTAGSWLRTGTLQAGKGTVFHHTSAAQEVECAADVSTDKTGTVMLEAPKPTTLTVNMVGTGLEATFLAFLL